MTTTASSPEALKVMSVVKCDVLIVEIALPGEGGVELIRRVHALKPENGGVVRAIALSGRVGDVPARGDAGLRRARWILIAARPWQPSCLRPEPWDAPSFRPTR